MFIVKRKGHKERFEEKKVYGSVYAACASADYSERQCEKIAQELTKYVEKFVVKKKVVKSIDIRKIIENRLKKLNKELAFYYEQHLPDLKKL